MGSGGELWDSQPRGQDVGHLLPPPFPCCYFFLFSFSQPLRDPGRGCASRKSKVGVSSAEQGEEHPGRRCFLWSPSNLPKTSPRPLGATLLQQHHPRQELAASRCRRHISCSLPLQTPGEGGGEDKAPAGANGWDRACSSLYPGVPLERAPELPVPLMIICSSPSLRGCCPHSPSQTVGGALVGWH